MKKFLLLILLFTSINVNGQSKNWGDLGIGIYNQKDQTGGIVLNCALNQVRGNGNIYRIRFNFTNELNFFTTSPQYAFSNGLLFGKNINLNNFDIYFLGGIGYSTGLERGDALYWTGSPFFPRTVYKTDYYFTPSIPLEIDIRFAPFRSFGLSVSVFGEVNSYNSHFGLLSKINFGRLK